MEIPEWNDEKGIQKRVKKVEIWTRSRWQEVDWKLKSNLINVNHIISTSDDLALQVLSSCNDYISSVEYNLSEMWAYWSTWGLRKQDQGRAVIESPEIPQTCLPLLFFPDSSVGHLRDACWESSGTFLRLYSLPRGPVSRYPTRPRIQTRAREVPERKHRNLHGSTARNQEREH